MTDHTPEQPGRTVAELADQLRAGVAALTLAEQLRSGRINATEYGRQLAALAYEEFPAEPLQLVLPVSWLALKLAATLSAIEGCDLATVLQWLGTEAAESPTP